MIVLQHSHKSGTYKSYYNENTENDSAKRSLLDELRTKWIPQRGDCFAYLSINDKEAAFLQNYVDDSQKQYFAQGLLFNKKELPSEISPSTLAFKINHFEYKSEDVLNNYSFPNIENDDLSIAENLHHLFGRLVEILLENNRKVIIKAATKEEAQGYIKILSLLLPHEYIKNLGFYIGNIIPDKFEMYDGDNKISSTINIVFGNLNVKNYSSSYYILDPSTNYYSYSLSKSYIGKTLDNCLNITTTEDFSNVKKCFSKRYQRLTNDFDLTNLDIDMMKIIVQNGCYSDELIDLNNEIISDNKYELDKTICEIKLKAIKNLFDNKKINLENYETIISACITSNIENSYDILFDILKNKDSLSEYEKDILINILKYKNKLYCFDEISNDNKIKILNNIKIEELKDNQVFQKEQLYPLWKFIIENVKIKDKDFEYLNNYIENDYNNCEDILNLFYNKYKSSNINSKDKNNNDNSFEELLIKSIIVDNNFEDYIKLQIKFSKSFINKLFNKLLDSDNTILSNQKHIKTLSNIMFKNEFEFTEEEFDRLSNFVNNDIELYDGFFKAYKNNISSLSTNANHNAIFKTCLINCFNKYDIYSDSISNELSKFYKEFIELVFKESEHMKYLLDIIFSCDDITNDKKAVLFGALQNENRVKFNKRKESDSVKDNTLNTKAANENFSLKLCKYLDALSTSENLSIVNNIYDYYINNVNSLNKFEINMLANLFYTKSANNEYNEDLLEQLLNTINNSKNVNNSILFIQSLLSNIFLKELKNGDGLSENSKRMYYKIIEYINNNNKLTFKSLIDKIDSNLLYLETNIRSDAIRFIYSLYIFHNIINCDSDYETKSTTRIKNKPINDKYFSNNDNKDFINEIIVLQNNVAKIYQLGNYKPNLSNYNSDLSNKIANLFEENKLDISTRIKTMDFETLKDNSSRCNESSIEYSLVINLIKEFVYSNESYYKDLLSSTKSNLFIEYYDTFAPIDEYCIDKIEELIGNIDISNEANNNIHEFRYIFAQNCNNTLKDPIVKENAAPVENYINNVAQNFGAVIPTQVQNKEQKWGKIILLSSLFLLISTMLLVFVPLIQSGAVKDISSFKEKLMSFMNYWLLIYPIGAFFAEFITYLSLDDYKRFLRTNKITLLLVIVPELIFIIIYLVMYFIGVF